MVMVNFIPFGGAGAQPWTDVATVVQLTTPTDSVLVQSGAISSPGTGGQSEQFGLSASTNGGNFGVALGYFANAFDSTIAVGWASTARSVNTPSAPGSFPCIAIGLQALTGPFAFPASMGSQVIISDCIAIGDAAQAGRGVGFNRDCISIGDAASAGGRGDNDLNGYSNLIAIGDSALAGGLANTGDTVVGTGDGSTVDFSGTLAGFPFPFANNTGGMILSYTIGGFLETAYTTGPSNPSAFIGPNVLGTSNFNFTNGNWVFHFSTAPDNLTNISLRPSYGSSECIAIGSSSNAAGTECVAIGDTSVAGSVKTDNNLIALGFGASASGGNNQIAIGNSATTAFNEAIAIGHSATVTGTNSVAIGQSASAAANQIALGAAGVTSILCPPLSTLTAGLGTFSDTANDTNDVLVVTKNPGASNAGKGINVSMGANRTGVGIFLNQTTGGSGLLIDVQNNASSKFKVDNAGIATSAGNIILGGNLQAASNGTILFNTRSLLTSPADGQILATNNSSAANASILQKYLASTKTASSYSVTATENNTQFNNSGAGAQVAFNLPAAAVGMTYGFYVVTAQNVRVVANGADTITVAGSVSAGGGRIDNTTVGGYVQIMCPVAGTWVAQYTQGTWTPT